MNETYFFDSYALYEIIKGNNNYQKYASSNVITTKLNLFELFYSLLRDNNENLGLVSLFKYLFCAIDFNSEIIIKAAKFKLLNKKKGVSMTDSIGYIMADKLQIKFLTGDKEFENIENVEFVK